MNYIKLVLLIFWVLVFVAELPKSALAQSGYSQEESFTIPWGDDPGDLSLYWKIPPPDYEDLWDMNPRPTAISSTGGVAIVDAYDSDIRRLTRYSIDGTFIAQIDLYENGLPMAQKLAISNDGHVLMEDSGSLYVLNQNLILEHNITLPYNNSNICVIELWPSINGGFWCIYTVSPYQSSVRELYVIEINLDGSLGNPLLLFSGSKDDNEVYEYYYVTPLGHAYHSPSFIIDQDGYQYLHNWYDQQGEILFKYSPSDELVYQAVINDALGWENNTDYFVMWSGDYYTQHATPDGLVITRFVLHHNPVCRCRIVTPMPYRGPSPAAIEFDTSGTFDEEGDDLTYHWDFDGDCIFDEPYDDSYTGDPDNPTHEYTQSGEYTVNLSVTDNYQGECETSVLASVRII